jgi:GH15 family glucan-1,4-alpha-glucosidase
MVSQIELLSSWYAGRKMGLSGYEEGWALLHKLLEFIELPWQWEDDGLWEVRSGRRHFTHSKIMPGLPSTGLCEVSRSWA